MKKIRVLCFHLFLIGAVLAVSSCQYKKATPKTRSTAEERGKGKRKAQLFNHQVATEAFAALVAKVKANVPPELKGYQSMTLINGSVLAAGSLDRESTIKAETDKITVTVIDAPKKDGARRRSGTLTIVVYLENGRAWVKQTLEADPVGNWKIPVNIVGDTLRAPAELFQYEKQDAASIATREKDLTYNLVKRTAEAGFSETENTEYNFAFGIDTENKGVYFDREVNNVTDGEVHQSKDKAIDGTPELKNLKVRLSVTAEKIEAVEL
jgi:hypothetical protein